MHITPKESSVSKTNDLYYGWGNVEFTDDIKTSSKDHWAYIMVSFNDTAFRVAWSFPNRQTYLRIKEELNENGWEQIDDEKVNFEGAINHIVTYKKNSKPYLVAMTEDAYGYFTISYTAVFK